MNQRQSLPEFSSIKKVHIIGVCGTLMGAFASYLKRCGIEVTGSDQNVYPPMSDVLQRAGVTLMSGYRAENLGTGESRPDLVVIGNVIRADNAEARAALEGGYAYSSLPEAMEQLLLLETQNLVVAGTHGKTTTSSLLAHVLTACKKDPSYFIGGVSQDLPFSFYISPGGQKSRNLFVLEGDEYDTAFWDKVPKFNHYLPDDVILTSVEFDHADIYADLNSVIQAFQGLISRIRKGGRLISCSDYATVRDLALQSKVPVISYGLQPEWNPRVTASQLHVKEGWTYFQVLEEGKKKGEITMQMSGAHNVLNALAVWIECQELGLDPRQVAEAIKTFQGVKRRQEVRGEPKGVLIIDDFAHHPTAVRETLRGLKLKYPGKRLFTVFEPRSATSRRKIFQTEYAAAFQESDMVWISSPYDQSLIPAADQFSSSALVEDLIKSGKTAFVMESVDEGVEDISRLAHPGDLVAVLSNGGFNGFIDKLLKALSVVSS